MLVEEIKILLGSDRYDLANFDNPGRIIGIICDDETPVPVRAVDEEDALQAAKGFLMLGSMSKQSQALPADVSRIGLSLAHSFPRTVEGTLGAIVSNGAQQFLLSANHIIWMNGWALGGTKIVVSPFNSPPFDPAGMVYADNDPLLGGSHLNTTQEVALAVKDASLTLPPAAQSVPGICRKGDTLFHLRHTGELVKATVRSVDFRLSLRFEFGRFLFSQQILLDADTKFAERGDSGGLLFRRDGGAYVPVALLWAGMPDSAVGHQNCIATPLADYFAARKLTFAGYRDPGAASAAVGY